MNHAPFGGALPKGRAPFGGGSRDDKLRRQLISLVNDTLCKLDERDEPLGLPEDTESREGLWLSSALDDALVSAGYYLADGTENPDITPDQMTAVRVLLDEARNWRPDRYPPPWMHEHVLRQDRWRRANGLAS